MNGMQLQLRRVPPLRLDLRGLLPTALAGLDLDAIARLPLGHGRATLALGDCFDLARFDAAQPTLRLEGEPAAMRGLDHIGCALAEGHVEVIGGAGDHAGALMRGGTLRIDGDAGLLAGCQMAGGRLEVSGSVGDWAASGLPGSSDGMRGGVFIVHGAAGTRLADRMRRGTLLVLGDVGTLAASRLVAGTVVLGGAVGAHLGWGQRRGSVLLLQPGAWQAPPTFVPAGGDAPVAWQLMARALSREFGRLRADLAALPQHAPPAWRGDLAADGRGEVWTLAPA